MNRLLRFFALSLLVACCFVSTASAADSVFFEFAPDSWASTRFIITGTQEPVYQLFSVRETTALTALDFWIDNIGEAGTASLRLSNGNDDLFSKTITIPQIAALPGGKKIHIPLSSSFTLEPGVTYSLQIDSSLPGLAFYTAERILALEHDRSVSNEYTYGAAKIGQVLQPFAFKMALYSPEVSGSGYITQQTDIIGGTPTQTQQTTEPQTQTIAITNARVVATTPTTALLAWTTNIASDSRASIRTQLNPLFVVKNATDPTWELEHTLLVEGLTPNVNYFADVFSTQGDIVVLTTYTIGFKTPAGSATPPSTPSSPSPTSSQTPTTQTTEPTPSTASSPSQSPSGPSAPAGASSASSAAAANEVTATQTGPGQTTLTWPDAQDASTAGYRIDIFDADHNLERSITVDKDTTSKNVPGLLSGTHHVVVYEKKSDGTFVKVTPSKEIVVTYGSIMGKLATGIGALVIIIGLGVFAVWKFRKEKTILPAEEGYDPNTY